MPWPTDAIAAVTHPNPNPYYEALMVEDPLFFDSHLNMWVASGKDAVGGVMTHPLCLVRPPAEKVPRALLNTPAEIIFRNVLRMNDGEYHQRTKQALNSILEGQNEKIKVKTYSIARSLWRRLAAKGFIDALSEFQFDFSVHVLGELLGFPDESLQNLASLMKNFAHCLSPAGRPEHMQLGIIAAERLLELFHFQLTQPSNHGILNDLKLAMQKDGLIELDCVAANGIGVLSQAYEATAGLIANSCLALATHLPVLDQVRNNPALVPAVVGNTLHMDPPVQNTRRFLTRDAFVAGRHMREGDVILLVLAAANRDHGLVEATEIFESSRKQAAFSFGQGVHRCPGEKLALTIAATAVEQLLAVNQDLEAIVTRIRYRPSANIRIAMFNRD